MELNDAFIEGTIAQGRQVYLASNPATNLIQTGGAYAGTPSVFARELWMLAKAGYRAVGDYLLPPG